MYYDIAGRPVWIRCVNGPHLGMSFDRDNCQVPASVIMNFDGIFDAKSIRSITSILFSHGGTDQPHCCHGGFDHHQCQFIDRESISMDDNAKAAFASLDPAQGVTHEQFCMVQRRRADFDGHSS